MNRGVDADDVRLALTGLLELDRTCDQFEAVLRAGGAPEMAAFLADAPGPVRPRLFRELLILELESHLDRGERPDAVNYHRRFPEHRDAVDEVFALFGPAGNTPPHSHHCHGGDDASPGQAETVADLQEARLHAEISSEVYGALRAAGYEVLGELGRGGMGIVYLTRRIMLNRLCAVKMILGGAHAGIEASVRFLAEAETIARLQHPNIVQIHHFGQAGDFPFVELEYLAGGSLDQALDGTPWPAAKAAELIETLARAVAEAHRLGIVHRDLKPANVLLTSDGIPKLGDFGLAKSLGFDNALTRTGQVVGSPSYMAPEQAESRSKEVGPATDVYSLGAILYELLTGHPPFKAATVIQTLDQVRSQEPVPLRQVQPDLPRDLETIGLKCLQKDPRRRYDGAVALAEDLDRFLHGRAIMARPVGAAEHAWKWARRQPAVALLSVALVSITAVAFALVSWQWHRAETEAAAEAAAHAEARQAHREALEEEAQLALNYGLDLCEQGEIGRGLLWLARSLELTTEAKVDRLDRAIRINLADWSSRLSRPLGRLRHRAPIRDLAFRPDGRMLVSAGEDGTVRTWDTATWQEAAPPPWAEVHPSGTGRIVGPIALNPREGRMLVAFDGEGRGLFWDIERRRRMGPILEHPSRTAVGAVVFSPDGRQLVTSGSDGMARRWDVATCRPIGEALRHGGVGITSLALSPDGQTLVTGGEDRRAIRWEMATGRCLGRVLLDSPVRKIAFSRDGQRIITGTRDGRLHVWDPELGRVSDLPPQGTAVTSIAISPDGNLFATGTEGGTVRLWDTTLLRQTGQTDKLNGAVRGLAFRPDSQALAIGQDDGTIRLRGVPRSTVIGRPVRGDSPVHNVTFSRDGTRLLLGSGKGAQWSDITGQRAQGPVALGERQGPGDPAPGDVSRRPDGEGDSVAATAVSPDGRTLATAHSSASGELTRCRVTLWDAERGTYLRQSHKLPDPPVGLAYSPDSQWLLTWGRGTRSALLWNVATLRQARPLFRSLEVAIHQAAFSADGKTLLLGCRDGTARLWDVARDETIVRDTYPHHDYPITAVAFDPLRPRIVTGWGP